MTQMTIAYQGEKHCELVHGPSGSVIETDAPKDNQGKGERFSPTDLVGAALGSCALTIMAMAAEKDGISLTGANAQVKKEMVSDPRRIGGLYVSISLPKNIPFEARAKLESAGLNCPVFKSIHPDIKTTMEFTYE